MANSNDDPILSRIGHWKVCFLYGALAVLLLPGVASLFILEAGMIPKALHIAFPQFFGERYR